MEKYIVNVFDVEYDIDELEDGDKMPDLPNCAKSPFLLGGGWIARKV